MSRMKNEHNGGSWESLGRRWWRDSDPPNPKMNTRDYEPDDGRIIYGPDDKPLKRVVDKRPRSGFRRDVDR